MRQKGLLNRQAKSMEGLFDNRLHSGLEGYFKGEGGSLRLQSPEGVVDVPYPHFSPMSTPHEPVNGNGHAGRAKSLHTHNTFSSTASPSP